MFHTKMSFTAWLDKSQLISESLRSNDLTVPMPPDDSVIRNTDLSSRQVKQGKLQDCVIRLKIKAKDFEKVNQFINQILI